MEPLPCVNCITLSMCIEKGKHTNGVTNLAFKCSLLNKWLTGSEDGYDMELLYKAHCYFARGEVDEIDPATL